MRIARLLLLLASVFLLALAVTQAQQAQKAQLLTADELNKLLPANAFLDGQNAPVQKRNAVGARIADGKIVLVMMIDTTGFSSQYQEKYVGMLITQGAVEIGTSKIKPGAYGLGRKKTTVGGKAGESFALYDLGGNPVAEVPAEKDAKLRPVIPVQLKTEGATGMRLYLGPYFVNLSSH